MTRLVILLALVGMTGPADAIMRKPDTLITRAVTCQLRDDELSTLMGFLPRYTPGMEKVARVYAAPSGNLYRLKAPMSALGFSTSEVYIQPMRFTMLVSGETVGSINQRLHLVNAPMSPASRKVRPKARLISFQLRQQGLAGKVLIGCEYDDPAAAGWLEPDR